MGIQYYLAPITTFSWETYTWDELRGLSKSENFAERLKSNPMPQSKAYSNIEEFLKDCETATGTITLLPDEHEEFRNWLKELLEEFVGY